MAAIQEEEDDNIEKLVDDFCKDSAEKETWLNVYGSGYRNLLIIDVDENLTKLNKTVACLLHHRLIELDIEHDSEEILVGLQMLRKMLSAGEYPKAEITIAIFSMIKDGMDKSVDPMLTTEAYRLASQLLHFLSPSKGDFRDYWRAVLLSLIAEDEIDEEKLLMTQKMFTKTLVKMEVAQKKNQNQRRAAGAYLDILCELLEIDFAYFLSKHSRDVANALLNGKNVPLISSLFWPNKMIQINSNVQGTFLNPIVRILRNDKDQADSRAYEICCRILAMIFELIRLVSRGGTIDKVVCPKTPLNLRRLFTEILDDEEVLELLNASTSFGWVKRAIRERLEIKRQ